MLLKMTLLSFLGSVFPVILFNIDRKKIFWCGLAGGIGWIGYSLTLDNTNSMVLASFIGAVVVNIYSEIMARIIHTPASMFYIPGIFPLVPGILAYSTIVHIVEKDFSQAISSGLATLSVGISISIGIMLSSTLIKFIFKVYKLKR
ncbi:MAG: threonine/serine exporter family protein [Clostridiaceae bacterium]|nr:threonine/serine exporter family protein [Clostridiaceae bacterium]